MVIISSAIIMFLLCAAAGTIQERMTEERYRRSIGVPKKRRAWEQWPTQQRVEHIATPLCQREYELSPFSPYQPTSSHYDSSFVHNIFADEEFDELIKLLAYHGMRLRLAPLKEWHRKTNPMYRHLEGTAHKDRVMLTARELGYQLVLTYRDGAIVR